MDKSSYQDINSQAQGSIDVLLHSENADSQASTTSHTLEMSSNTIPRQVLSKEQWEELRPLISRLYIDENRTFKAVARVLQESHNFVPTKRQFTKRLAEWGLKKNSTQLDRQTVIQQLSSARKSQYDIEIDGRKVSRAKLTRWKKEAAIAATAKQEASLVRKEANSSFACNFTESSETTHPNWLGYQQYGMQYQTATGANDCSQESLLDSWPWAYVDVPGSPKLSRLFAALSLQCPAEGDPLDLSDMSEKVENSNPRHYISGSELEAMSPGSRQISNQAIFGVSIATPSPFNELYPFPPAEDSNSIFSAAAKNPQYVINISVSTHNHKYLQAQVDHYEKIIQLERNLSEDNPKIIDLKERLGGTYFDLGRYEIAVNCWREVVVARDRFYGPGSLRSLAASIQIIKGLFNLGKWAEAEDIHQKIFPIVLQNASTESVLVLETLYTLALLLGAAGQNEEANKVWRQQLQIGLSSRGPKHPMTLKIMDRMSDTISHSNLRTKNRSAQKQEAEVAEHLLRVSLQLHREAEPGTEPIVGQNRVVEKYIIRNITPVADLVRVLRQTSKHDESAKLAQGVLDRLRAFLGEEHPSTLNLATELGITLREQGKLEESETLLGETLQLRSKVLGERHVGTLDSMYEFAITLQARSDFHESSKILRDCMRIRFEDWDPADECTVLVCEALSECYEQQGYYEEALSIYRDLIARIRGIKGDSHPAIAEVEEMIRDTNNRYRNFQKLWDVDSIYTGPLLKISSPADG